MRQYVTEILSVGTELLLGHVTNTDARDVSELLSRIGINVKYHTVVGDNPKRLRDCVAIARERADILITTGGLGPTCDDLTKQILRRRSRACTSTSGAGDIIRPTTSPRPCCPRAARSFTTTGARPRAAPSRRRGRSSSCCPARPTSACPCSGPMAFPISRACPTN